MIMCLCMCVCVSVSITHIQTGTLLNVKSVFFLNKFCVSVEHNYVSFV